jgi:DNA-binding MarR family transcriptional regulator
VTAWLGVVSQAHVLEGAAGGFAQLCHGKAQALRRMQRGDWLVYYSPALEMGGSPLRAFTAIGEVVDDEVFPFDMGGGFVPFRRRVHYLPAKPVPLSALAQRLDLSLRQAELGNGASPGTPRALEPGLPDHRLGDGGRARYGRHPRWPRRNPVKTKAPLPSRHAGPGESPGFLLWKVSNLWQRRQRDALQPFGLSHSQFVLLAATTWFGASETLTQARLSELTGVDPMTTSQVLRTLEAAQLVERRSHPTDPRAKAIAATPGGREKARRAIVAVEATDAAFFAPLAKRSRSLLPMLRALLKG